MDDNTSLERRVQNLEDQLNTLREAAVIRSLPGNTVAIKALLKSLLSATVPAERNTIFEVATAIAESAAIEAMPIGSLTDIDSPARRRMLNDINAFFNDLRSL